MSTEDKKQEERLPVALCGCGCGRETKISPKTCTSKGWIKGHPRNFIQGHHMGSGLNHPRWKGGRKNINGRSTQYSMILLPEHPRNKGRYVYEHILIAEKALGKYLPEGAVVHHIDENGLNNSPNNLVICQDGNYHKLLHQRMRRRSQNGN